MKNVLYKRVKDGSISQWEVRVLACDDGTARITRFYGKVGGTITERHKEVNIGKNIGRSNETTPYEQALSEARAMVNGKEDEAYVTNIDEVDNVKLSLPMRAVDWWSQCHKIIHPCFGQPKLNGIKCLSERQLGVKYTSKKFKEFTTLAHLTPYLCDMMEVGDIFDGEIFHPEWHFQDITSCLKKMQPGTEQLQYWVYDIALGIGFGQRWAWLQYQIPADHDFIKLVETVVINSDEELDAFHERNVANGFEGTIVRNMEGAYVMGFDSENLQKRKDFIDEEFEIIGGKAELAQVETPDGYGYVKCIVFKVKNPKGLTPEAQTFDVRPEGTIERRAGWFRDLSSLIGKDLTVRYQELSKDNVPIFPVGVPAGLEVRDYE